MAQKKMNDSRRFPAKILLFGEYSLLLGSRGLSLPFDLFSGSLEMGSPKSSQSSNQEIKNLLKYIDTLPTTDKELLNLDLDTLRFDLTHGLYFDSSIPMGFGVGSSGALVAAIFSKYSHHQIDQDEIPQMRKRMALMEDFFHQSSSGFDPLVCLYKKPLVINDKYNAEFMEPEPAKSGNRWLFIFDSGRTKKTAPMVNLFKNKLQDQQYAKLVDNQFTPLTNSGIDAFMRYDAPFFEDCFKKISDFQIEFLSEMIPEDVKRIWLQGRSSDLFHLKLCGAGGGGFFLGHCADYGKLKAEFPELPIRKVYCLG